MAYSLDVFVLLVYTINHEQQTVHLKVYHIIWCPKWRRRILLGEVAQWLEQLVYEAATEHCWQVLALSIQPDHVHLFIHSNPYTLPTDIARLIKGRSSHVFRDKFPYLQHMLSLWTGSTFYSGQRE